MFDFPTELVVLISSYLPTSSIATLALCNKKLSAMLSDQVWTYLRDHKLERIEFLTLLSRDLPLRYACNGCGNLHLSSTVPGPGDKHTRQQPMSCIPASTLGGYYVDNVLPISDYFCNYSLRFAHVQLALKRHRYGPPHGISLQDLGYSEIRLIGHNAFFFTVEARIDAETGELLLRSQEWIVSMQHPRSHFMSRSMNHGVCQHLMTYHGELGLDDTLTGIMRCRVSHNQTHGIDPRNSVPGRQESTCDCMRLHQCQVCPMEYHLDIVDLRNVGETLCVTKWFNLGCGSSAQDPLWRGHELMPEAFVPHGLQLGRIRSQFESQEGCPVSGLTATNKEMLQNDWCIVEQGRFISMRDHGLGWSSAGGGPKVGFLEEMDSPGRLRQLSSMASDHFTIRLLLAWISLAILSLCLNIWSSIQEEL
ncbi:hypothetical protein VTL71DRAFT_5540 [Oculimacula yallundae]|uniref:F-box domain-containing protein n=1 Tax=Oculimacula yallundae TaxID=86028 RepID=A0ABR4C1F0_9HELO